MLVESLVNMEKEVDGELKSFGGSSRSVGVKKGGASRGGYFDQKNSRRDVDKTRDRRDRSRSRDRERNQF